MEDRSTQIAVRWLRAAFWVVLVGITLAAFIGTVDDAVESPGTDLRSRVVGARAMMLGLDPYFMEARTDQIQTLQDPDRYAIACTRCTYAPTLLCLYMPLANLPYETQRFIWFGIEWCGLAATIVLLRAILPGRLLKEVFTAIGIFFFADSVFWRLHLERGQYYVFIALLMSLTAWLCLGSSAPPENSAARDRWWNGIPLGIAAAIRLTPLAALLPLWVAGFRRTAVGAAITAAACIGGTLALRGPGLWQSYFRNVAIQSRWNDDAEFRYNQRALLPPLPVTVEGVTFGRTLDIPNANVTLEGDVLQALSWRFQWTPSQEKWQPISRAGAVVVCLLFPLALRRRQGLAPAEKLAAAFLCTISAEFFLPTRISYADVVFLVPICLLMPSMLRHRRGTLFLAITLLALAMCHIQLPQAIPISVLRPPLVMIGLLGYLAIRLARRPVPSPVAADPVEELRAEAA